LFQSADRDLAPRSSEFWQANRVPFSPLYPRVRFARWLHTDSEENYRRRGNRALSTESVGYSFNSLGYRGPEFERSSGDGAILFVGDSNTFGLGMPYERLWTSLVTGSVAELQKRRVHQFNLGFGATGSDYVAMVIHQSIDALRPDAVCVLWPSRARITWFHTPRRQVFFLPEWKPGIDTAEHDAFLRLATDAQGFFNFVRNFQLVRSRLAERGIPYFWGLLDPLPTDILDAYTGLDGHVGSWDPVDKARDGRHAGIRTHAAFAAAMVDAMERADGARPDAARAAAPSPRYPTPTRPAGPQIDRLPRIVRRTITATRLRRRVRALRRRDPFIY
jgi:hypothetical protein